MSYSIVVLLLFLCVLPRSFFSNLINSTPKTTVENRLRIKTQFASLTQQKDIQKAAFISYDNIEDITQYHLKYELLPIEVNNEPITFTGLTSTKTISEIKEQLETYDLIIIKQEHKDVMEDFSIRIKSSFLDNSLARIEAVRSSPPETREVKKKAIFLTLVNRKKINFVFFSNIYEKITLNVNYFFIVNFSKLRI